MVRFGTRLSVALLALALAASVAADATAAEKKKKKRFLFFDTSVSRSETPAAKPHQRLFGRKWWDRYGNDPGVRVYYGKPKSAAADDKLAETKKKPVRKNIITVPDADPEDGMEGFGLGNLTYVAPKLVPVDGNQLKAERPAGDAAAAAVYDVFVGKDLGLRVLPDIRQAVLAHYAARNYRPVWFDAGRITARGSEALKVLSEADAEGLQAASYLPPDLTDFSAAERIAATDFATQAKVDVALTALAAKYARDASGGQFDPARLSLYHDIKPVHVSAEAALRVLGWTPYPESYLRSLHPSHPAYAAMKAELADMRKAEADPTFVAIPAGKRVKRGQTDERMQLVRDRLLTLGIVTLPTDDPAVLDDELADALKQFQRANAVKASGNLDDATIKVLNHQDDASKERRLVYNMERLRWLPRQLGHRHVFVNQAAFEVEVMDAGKEIWRSDVIVGKPMTQTAVFQDEIEMVVFNPSWGVPLSIIANEYLPKLRRDPGYLDRIGFKVATAEGKTVSSRSVNWGAYGNQVPFSIQQPPGAKNALGELKFLFPNSHNIYMHDTPNRELFDESVRAFSHGCVRVRNPRDFAAVLLGWDRDKVDANTDSKKSQTVRLKAKVPIHIAYFTAWPDESGKIVYYKDIYRRDETLEKAMTATTVAQR